jgi:hypothetical protein
LLVLTNRGVRAAFSPPRRLTGSTRVRDDQVSQQTMRQKARRDLRTVTSKRRAALLERAKRLEDLAVQVMTAVGERDAAVAAAEERAGNALREMTTVEGVTLREAVEWCGNQIGVREAARLPGLADDGQDQGECPEDAQADGKDEAQGKGSALSTAGNGGSTHRHGGWMTPALKRSRRRSRTRRAHALDGGGHGRFRYAPGRVIIAHRFAFAVMHGVDALAEARLLGHRCHNPLCLASRRSMW